ncbi:MAG: IS110 family transposase [Chloroflexi bacterium]|nr:IS110 family transposase [Chloroflexota bacterium]
MVDVLYERCAGLDVHKKTVVACCVHSQPNGRKEQETRTLGTRTGELLALLDWLGTWECTHVAMESTGEYWKAVYNILEGQVEILLVNARHLRNVPGRKTDVHDAAWIAELLRHGLLRGSFVPPRPQRELRGLTRQRSAVVRERSAVLNRVQKVLEEANIKLASVASEVSGASARAMLEAMVAGETEARVLAELARGRLRAKRGELEQALVGRVSDHHRFLLDSHLQHIDFLDGQIERFSQQIAKRMEVFSPPPDLPTEEPPAAPAEGGETLCPSPGADSAGPTLLTGAQAVALLDTIPGIDCRLAEVIVAEVGVDMQRFPNADHLASWAGVAPGNNESAGKRRSGKTSPGNSALCQALNQAAHAAARTKNTYLSAQYHRLAARRGNKRAIVAVAHSILIIIYHMLSRQERYRELGGNYFDERKRESVTNRLIRRLEKLGYHVSLDPKPAMATIAP